jgi:Uma2 family endonuclease
MTTETPTLQLVVPATNAELDISMLQGLWTPEMYLRLTDATNQLFEFTDGTIEVLPMPTDHHQAISQWLFVVFLAIAQRGGGVVRYAPLRLKVRPNTFREPDLLFLQDVNDARRQARFWTGADLVVEIVSPDNPERDTKVKRADYAEAGIPEYWIVNPLTDTITVLTLDGATYREHGVFGRESEATSALLSDLRVAVAAVFDAR